MSSDRTKVGIPQKENLSALDSVSEKLTKDEEVEPPLEGLVKTVSKKDRSEDLKQRKVISSEESGEVRKNGKTNLQNVASFETESEGQSLVPDKFKSSLEVMYAQSLNSGKGEKLGNVPVKPVERNMGVKTVVKQPGTASTGIFVKPTGPKPSVPSSGTTKASSRPLSKQGSAAKESAGNSRAPTVSRNGSLKKPPVPAQHNRLAASAAKPDPKPLLPNEKPKRKLLFVK